MTRILTASALVLATLAPTLATAAPTDAVARGADRAEITLAGLPVFNPANLVPSPVESAAEDTDRP
ncbi:hypothetical protein [Roseobacter sp. HKCCA0434]|uniref:hypothetical protein n=1 Tax=Roseobacter sp. HKCCA0434 TaxID=3079297 RepID=UPI002905CF51|nr:hypothetical protein [Roseobacter sp. HKCCA0434]